MSTNKDTDTPPLQDASAAFEQALQEKNQEHYLLKLYISGMTPNSQRAIKNVQKICEEYLGYNVLIRDKSRASGSENN